MNIDGFEFEGSRALTAAINLQRYVLSRGFTGNYTCPHNERNTAASYRSNVQLLKLPIVAPAKKPNLICTGLKLVDSTAVFTEATGQVVALCELTRCCCLSGSVQGTFAVDAHTKRICGSRDFQDFD